MDDAKRQRVCDNPSSGPTLAAMKRSVFFLSDRTGITAEAMGRSLLTQFEHVDFVLRTIPFIDTTAKAQEAVARINQAADTEGMRPLLFGTLIDPQVREIVAHSRGLLLDPFDVFITPLERELGVHSTHAVGRSHAMGDYATYKHRIDAVNYALSHDDGATTRQYGQADIILVGVSRSGKTPTCLYLALHFGLLAANYPLTEDDFTDPTLPKVLQPFREKLFGLTIDAGRLHQIRNERRPDSKYAELRQCQRETEAAEAMYRRERVPYIDTSSMSIEEIGSTILHRTGRERRLYS